MLPDPAQGRSFPPRPARWDESADPDSTGGLEYGSDIAKPEGRCHSGSGDSPRGSAACYVGTVPPSTRTEMQVGAQAAKHHHHPLCHHRAKWLQLTVLSEFSCWHLDCEVRLPGGRTWCE